MVDEIPADYSNSPHSRSADELLAILQTTLHGLDQVEAERRLSRFGLNTLPRAKLPGLPLIFVRQFANPLIYILVAATVFSVFIQEWTDAAFIFAVLLLNALIGTAQEYNAQRAATSLQKLVNVRSRVLRNAESYEIDAEKLVPGDIIFLESGDRIPADVRLLATTDLEVDESLLTGESTSVLKNASPVLDTETVLGDRVNMTFAGTIVNRGRGHGIIVATGQQSELGRIASTVLKKPDVSAPLLIRMEKFTKRVAIIMGLVTFLLAFMALLRGMPVNEIVLVSVALAVAAIPEGLPVAITVALAIGMRRMARRNVIIRKLIAVESLGSCTYFATDKTGTLTLNQLTVKKILLATGQYLDVSGQGKEPVGQITSANGELTESEKSLLSRICYAAILPNDAFLGRRDGDWVTHGDAVDVALLSMAHKFGLIRSEALSQYREIATIPFESERLYAASMNRDSTSSGKANAVGKIFIKGAVEKLLPMCTSMAMPEEDAVIDYKLIQTQALQLAEQGYRVLALASGQTDDMSSYSLSENHLTNLTLLGLVGMIDPLRKEAKQAIASCRDAGIEVSMITGDHPVTALAIAKELELAESMEDIVTGPQLLQADKPDTVDQLTGRAHVFARVEPRQKLSIVRSLQRNGHFVAVSGDGANDAPAMRASHVGVAMGKSGTDVARETADLILADDNFASMVAGIEEGRIAYANVRKVIFLVVTTGAAELVLFALALLSGQPLPLTAIQLLWLNLVTNGIQDVALAFEPGEGDELRRAPRSPKESIFNRVMIERISVLALTIGITAFVVFKWLLYSGYSIEEARNGTMLLMVLFENIHVFNSRSETLSAFTHNPLRNPILLFGTIAAQAIHIGAMYTPGLNKVLDIQPVSLEHWFELLGIALIVLLVAEIQKYVKRHITQQHNS